MCTKKEPIYGAIQGAPQGFGGAVPPNRQPLDSPLIIAVRAPSLHVGNLFWNSCLRKKRQLQFFHYSVCVGVLIISRNYFLYHFIPRFCYPHWETTMRDRMHGVRLCLAVLLGVLNLEAASISPNTTQQFPHSVVLDASEVIHLYWEYNDTHITFEVCWNDIYL